MVATRTLPEPECPCCGSEEIYEMSDGTVCTDCGVKLSCQPRMVNVPTYNQQGHVEAVHSRNEHADTYVIKQIRNRHPACETQAIEFSRQLGSDFTKGMSKEDQKRHALALAFLVYRDDSQSHITIRSLATEIHVPEERLSKDVKSVAARLGIKGWQNNTLEDEDDEDDPNSVHKDFNRALLTRLQLGIMRKGRVGIREASKWCKKIYIAASNADERDLINIAPNHRADAAIALFCQANGSPFVDGALGGRKRKRDGSIESTDEATFRVLTENMTARRAMKTLKKYVA